MSGRKKLLIFGGTTEGRVLAERLVSAGYDVTVSVATPAGAEALKGISCTVAVGRLPVPEMKKLAEGFDMIIDATHPYAKEVSANLRTVSSSLRVPLRRVCREASAPDQASGNPDDAAAGTSGNKTDGNERQICASSCAEAAGYLKEKEGNILLTTGSKELRAFAEIAPERLYPRVLPIHESLYACEELSIPHRNILALYGPFSLEMNLAMLRQYHIQYLVPKDGGREGGFPEKQEAAHQAGTTLVIIKRPPDSGVPMEELIRELEA